MSSPRVGARRRRGGAGRPRALRTRPAVHHARVPERHPREPASGVHRRTGGGSPDRARPRAGRDTEEAPASISFPARSSSRRRASTVSASSQRQGRRSTSSYFAGSTPTQRGPWLSWLDEIFGVRHRLRYGLVDPIEDDEVTLSFVDDLGDLAEGSSLTFRVAGEPSARAYLPWTPMGAEVVAIDGHGRPALLRHRLGAGRPCSARTRSSTWPPSRRVRTLKSTWRIYSALAAEAGVERPVGSTTRGSSWPHPEQGVGDCSLRQLLRRPDHHRARRLGRGTRPSNAGARARALRRRGGSVRRCLKNAYSDDRDKRRARDARPNNRESDCRPTCDPGTRLERDEAAPDVTEAIESNSSSSCAQTRIRRSKEMKNMQIPKRRTTGVLAPSWRCARAAASSWPSGRRSRVQDGLRDGSPPLTDLYMSGNQWSPNNDLNPAKNWDYITGLVGLRVRDAVPLRPAEGQVHPVARDRERGRRRHVRDDRSARRQVERRQAAHGE